MQSWPSTGLYLFSSFLNNTSEFIAKEAFETPIASESVVCQHSADLNLKTENTENFEAKGVHIILIYIGMR